MRESHEEAAGGGEAEAERGPQGAAFYLEQEEGQFIEHTVNFDNSKSFEARKCTLYFLRVTEFSRNCTSRSPEL